MTDFTDKQLLNTILVTQVEILDRLAAIEDALNIDAASKSLEIPRGVDALAEIENRFEGATGEQFKSAIDDLVHKVSR